METAEREVACGRCHEGPHGQNIRREKHFWNISGWLSNCGRSLVGQKIGCEVETYSDGERGIAKERMAAAYGIKYRIEKTDGSVFTAYDSNLEVIRRPEQKVKSCNRSKKKPKREMER